MTRLHSAGRVVVRVLCLAGLLALGYVTYAVIDGKVYQPMEHRQLERVSPNAAARAVGHSAESALPGEPGNVVLADHRDMFFPPHPPRGGPSPWAVR